MAGQASPFPGMDPYLESPYGWGSVHGRLIYAICDLLADLVAPDYVVRTEERVYLTHPGDADRAPMEPDIYVLREQTAPYTTVASVKKRGLFTVPTLLEIRDLAPEVHDRYIEIRTPRNGEVITVIELLSPFNKRPGAQGFQAFQEKRREVMASRTHWIEIDLLRAGVRPPEVAYQSDYYALLKRGDRPHPIEVWFFNLRERMPTIAVPLRNPEPDVPLDLQAAFHEVYTRARYATDIDYTQPVPPPPLRPDDRIWTQACLRQWEAERATWPS